MKDWIPLLQSVLWPAVVAVVVWRFRLIFLRVLAAIAHRIERGDPFEAGTGGIKLGAGQQPKPEDATHKELVERANLPHTIYLLHRARRAADLDRGGREYYRLRIWLDADEPKILDEVSSVEYHLHPTFRDPVRNVTDRASEFALATAGWGQFNLWAEVKFRDGDPPLQIERYINF